MSENEMDPGASTEMFQAFVDRAGEPEESGSRWLWALLAVGALVIVAAFAWLLLGG